MAHSLPAQFRLWLLGLTLCLGSKAHHFVGSLCSEHNSSKLLLHLKFLLFHILGNGYHFLGMWNESWRCQCVCALFKVWILFSNSVSLFGGLLGVGSHTQLLWLPHLILCHAVHYWLSGEELIFFIFWLSIDDCSSILSQTDLANPDPGYGCFSHLTQPPPRRSIGTAYLKRFSESKAAGCSHWEGVEIGYIKRSLRVW